LKESKEEFEREAGLLLAAKLFELGGEDLLGDGEPIGGGEPGGVLLKPPSLQGSAF